MIPMITANGFIDDVEKLRFSGSHHRYGSSRRYGLAVITMTLFPGAHRGSPAAIEWDGEGTAVTAPVTCNPIRYSSNN